MPTIAPQVHPISTSELRNVAVDFSGKLDSGELLTGTPTVTEVGTSDLVLASKQVNAADRIINGATVATGKAVQFTVDASGSSAGQRRTVDIVCGTDAGQTVHGRVVLKVTN